MRGEVRSEVEVEVEVEVRIDGTAPLECKRGRCACGTAARRASEMGREVSRCRGVEVSKSRSMYEARCVRRGGEEVGVMECWSVGVSMGWPLKLQSGTQHANWQILQRRRPRRIWIGSIDVCAHCTVAKVRQRPRKKHLKAQTAALGRSTVCHAPAKQVGGSGAARCSPAGRPPIVEQSQPCAALAPANAPGARLARWYVGTVRRHCSETPCPLSTGQISTDWTSAHYTLTHTHTPHYTLGIYTHHTPHIHPRVDNLSQPPSSLQLSALHLARVQPHACAHNPQPTPHTAAAASTRDAPLACTRRPCASRATASVRARVRVRARVKRRTAIRSMQRQK